MKALSALSCLILALATSGLAAQTPVATAASGAEAPDLKRGRLLFIQCRACHELNAGLPHKVGPNLNGMLGRKAGTAAGFTQYSPALRAWGQIWDLALLDKWIEKPSSVVPGNSMAFAGLTAARDRAALIGYLQAETRAPRP
jgi:cytochrome c